MATGGKVGDTKDHSSEVQQEHTCGECNKGGRITEVSHYCPECDQYYCKACLCDHDVIGRSGIQRWGTCKGATLAEDAPKDVGNEEMCLKHENVKVELYCKDHDVVFCSLCLSTTHRMCDNTTKLTKLETEESLLRNDQKQLQDDSEALSKELDTLHRERTMKQIVLKRSHDKYISNVESFRRLINQTFDSIAKDGDHIKQEYNEKFEADKLLSERGKTQQAQLFQVLERSKDQTLPFTFLKKWNEWVILQRGILQKLHSTDVKTDFKLIAEQDIQTIIRTIEGLGQKQLGYPVCSATQQGDKEVCEIVGICQLANGNMILADASNKKLKFLDDTYTIVSSFEVEATPVAICTLDETQIAVAMNNNTVQIVSVEDTLKVSCNIQLTIDISDIAALNSELYILSGCPKSTVLNSAQSGLGFGSASTVKVEQITKKKAQQGFLFGSPSTAQVDIHIYSSTGNPVGTISVTVNDNSRKSSRSLSVIGDTGNMYVADHNSLYYCNSKGETLATLAFMCNGISSVCIDDSGLVNVSATDHNEVVLVKREGNSLSKYTELQVERPTALCWDKRIGRLVICTQGKDYVYLV